MPKFKRDEIPYRLARLKILMDHVYGQMEYEENRANLIRFLNRLPNVGKVASPLAINRWADGLQFPGAGNRKRLAASLGIDISVLDGFLLQDTPSKEEFLALIPPVPKEYHRRLSFLGIDTGDPVAVSDAIFQLSSYLDLEHNLKVSFELQQKLIKNINYAQDSTTSKEFEEIMVKLLAAYLSGTKKDINSITPKIEAIING